MEYIITGLICYLLGIGTMIGVNIATPPKIMKQEIITTVKTEVTSQNELRNYSIQETKIYNGLSNQQFLFAITNQTGYSNLLKSIVTNTNNYDTITNRSENYAMK